MLRLGFHDCVRYQDANGKIVNGCDGCLSNKGMINESMLDFHNTDKKTFKGPDVTNTSNNGLLFTADILEEIYTTTNFPKKTSKLTKSMQASGKSRADLWAFAALVASEYGILQNNLACDGKGNFYKFHRLMILILCGFFNFR